MHRFYANLPTFLTLLSIFIVSQIYLKIMSRKMAKQLNSKEWLKANPIIAYILFGFPLAFISASTIEELIFRGPLIVMFPKLNQDAWLGIFISSTLFGFSHFSDSLLHSSRVFWRDEETPDTDNIDELIAHYKSITTYKQSLVYKLVRVVSTILLGIFFGFLAVKYQTLWISVVAHALWNLLSPIVLPVLGIIIFLIICYIQGIWERRNFHKRIGRRY